jgi:hypothetical protein
MATWLLQTKGAVGSFVKNGPIYKKTVQFVKAWGRACLHVSLNGYRGAQEYCGMQGLPFWFPPGDGPRTKIETRRHGLFAAAEASFCNRKADFNATSLQS